MAGYAANCPISRPNTAMNFSNDVDMNGFGWDKNHGLFVPSDQAVDAQIPPTMVLPQRPNKNTSSVA